MHLPAAAAAAAPAAPAAAAAAEPAAAAAAAAAAGTCLGYSHSTEAYSFFHEHKNFADYILCNIAYKHRAHSDAGSSWVAELVMVW